MAVVDFDPAAHRYTLPGRDRDLISVTQALHAAGLVDDRWFNERAAQRGTAVHAAVQTFIESNVVPEDEIVAPFFDAYLAFQSEAGFVADGAEERVCDPLLSYAGTLDLRGQFPRFAFGSDLIDIKTGGLPSWVGYQTAAYARLLRVVPVRRWALELRANGSYTLHPLTQRTDEKVFMAALTVAQAKRGWL